MSETLGTGYLRVSKNPPTTVNLPVSTDPPAEIDTSGDLSIHVSIFSDAAFHFTWADDAAEGLTRIASAATRGSRPAGNLEIDISGIQQNLYIRSQAAVALEGLSYYFGEPD